MKFARVVEWVGGHELSVLLGALAVVIGTWGFIGLADEVLEGDTQAFDTAVLRMLRQPDNPEVPIGPKWLREAGRDITALGGNVVLLLMIIAVSGFLYLNGKTSALAVVLGSTLSGWAVTAVLKALFARERPTVVPHLAEVYTSSFPSGHSMMSAVVYLTMGALLAQLSSKKRQKAYCLIVAGILTVLVGLSRVYLGVHYPTDVLAGWAAGLVWASLCWLFFRYLQKRGQVEKPE